MAASLESRLKMVHDRLKMIVLLYSGCSVPFFDSAFVIEKNQNYRVQLSQIDVPDVHTLTRTIFPI